jgi:transcriptional regulator with XRE-family HTH domain
METNSVEKVLDKVLSKIREERKNKGWSHENMAEELGLSPSAYNKIERQESKLSLQRFLEIQALLEIPINELLDINSGDVYNQSLHDQSIGHQQVENLYQDNKELSDEFIKALKSEVAFLKELLSSKK